MALKSVLTEDEFDELGEELRAHYSKFEDKYVVDVDGWKSHPAVVKIKKSADSWSASYTTMKEELEGIKESLAPFLDEEIKLDELDPAALTKAADFLKNGGTLEGDKFDVEGYKARITAPLARQIEDLKGQVEKANGAYEGVLRDNALQRAIAEAKVAPHFVPAVQAMFRDKVKVRKEGDDVVTEVDTEYGPQSVSSFMADWAKSDQGAHFVAGAENSGGGANPGSKAGGGKNPWAPDSWSPSGQVAIFRENPARAREMAAKHGKKIGDS